MKPTEKLLHCPFCAGIAGFGKTAAGTYFVNCRACLASTGGVLSNEKQDKEMAAEEWNKRTTPFEMFFVMCLEYCAINHVGPDDYKWDLQNPGIWLEKFKAGMTPVQACNSIFRSH